MKDPYKMILRACTPRGCQITGGENVSYSVRSGGWSYEIGRRFPNGRVRRIIWFFLLKDEVMWSPPGEADPWRHLTDLNDPKCLDVIKEAIRREVENDRARGKPK